MYVDDNATFTRTTQITFIIIEINIKFITSDVCWFQMKNLIIIILSAEVLPKAMVNPISTSRLKTIHPIYLKIDLH